MKKNRLKTVIFKQKSLLLYKYCFLCYIEPIWKSDDEESRSFECLQRSPAEAERDGWRKTEDGF